MSIINAIPTCFYHPLKIIFLDDNRAFLDALDLEFGARINMVTLTNPDTALQEINNNSQDFTQLIFKSKKDVNVDTTTDRVIGIEFSNMLNLVYDGARFDHVAVLVVDYDMPNINGIEFCQKLNERKIFRVMLTAEADKDTAIKAFNSGLIDKFILKTSEELHLEITLAVQELTQRYFKELSRNIISGHEGFINDLFRNKLYHQLFADLVSQVQAVEYYMVDNSGSFLFLDKDANPTWLIIRHNQELEEQLDLLHGYDLPVQIMESIIKKEKLLFLFSEKEYKKPINGWVEYMFDSKKLDNNYYYSIVCHHLTDAIDWDRVVSYSEYIAKENNIE